MANRERQLAQKDLVGQTTHWIGVLLVTDLETVDLIKTPPEGRAVAILLELNACRSVLAFGKTNRITQKAIEGACTRCAYQAEKPPSTTRLCPVT